MPADDFFQGTYETALEDSEILTAIEVPKPQADGVAFFDEITRRHGDFALAGMAATAQLEGDTLSNVRMAFFAVSSAPAVPEKAIGLIEGTALSAIDVDAVMAAATDGIDVFGDLHTSDDAKRHLMRVLMRRALSTLTNGKIPPQERSTAA